MKYLGMEFKNYQELKDWNKQGHINHYKMLAKMFSNNPTMELNVMMCKCADVLVKQFGLTYSEVEQIELSCMAV